MGGVKNVVENPLGDSNFSKITRLSILWDHVKLSKCPRYRSKMIWDIVKHSIESWDIISDFKIFWKSKWTVCTHSGEKNAQMNDFDHEKSQNLSFSFISHHLSDLDELVIQNYLFKVLSWCSAVSWVSHERFQAPQCILNRD